VSIALTAAAAVLTACGGGPSGPVPLTHHFDDMHIASVPLEEKKAVVESQNAYSVAKMEHAKAQADATELKTELSVAKNELEQAKLAESSAKDQKAAADKSLDQARVGRAASVLRSAQIARKIAAEKIAYLQAKAAYQKQHTVAATAEMYAAEAQYELAKARVAATKGISPAGFAVADYEAQSMSRSESAQRLRAVAKQKLADADSKRKKWEMMQSAAASEEN
jgi:hypothetical protein